MEGQPAFHRYLEGALETFGVTADEEERAVMTGVWSLYEPGMELLRDADLDGIEPEPHSDMSGPPAR